MEEIHVMTQNKVVQRGSRRHQDERKEIKKERLWEGGSDCRLFIH
jgi:hypothetical protein